VTSPSLLAAHHPDVRIAEYSGLDTTNPLDTSGGAKGTRRTSDSGPASTSNANDLLVGAIPTRYDHTPRYWLQRVAAITADGDIFEESGRECHGPGYNATALPQPKLNLGSCRSAAFRAATGGGSTTTPTISSLNPTLVRPAPRHHHWIQFWCQSAPAASPSMAPSQLSTVGAPRVTCRE